MTQIAKKEDWCLYLNDRWGRTPNKGTLKDTADKDYSTKEALGLNSKADKDRKAEGSSSVCGSPWKEAALPQNSIFSRDRISWFNLSKFINEELRENMHIWYIYILQILSQIKMFSSEDNSFSHCNQALTIPRRKEMQMPNYVNHVNLFESIISPLRKEQLGLGLLHLNWIWVMQRFQMNLTAHAHPTIMVSFPAPFQTRTILLIFLLDVM